MYIALGSARSPVKQRGKLDEKLFRLSHCHCTLLFAAFAAFLADSAVSLGVSSLSPPPCRFCCRHHGHCRRHSPHATAPSAGHSQFSARRNDSPLETAVILCTSPPRFSARHRPLIRAQHPLHRRLPPPILHAAANFFFTLPLISFQFRRRFFFNFVVVISLSRRLCHYAILTSLQPPTLIGRSFSTIYFFETTYNNSLLMTAYNSNNKVKNYELL